MFRSINPATGGEVGRFEALTTQALEEKIARAARVFAEWRRSPIERRTALLAALADRYLVERDRLAEMATAEMGKTFASARAEVEKCAAAFRHYAEHGAPMLAPRHIVLGHRREAEVHWLPLGPVLAVMPWNFPYWQVVRFLAPTILAGNVGLLKHASNVQGVAALIEEMVLEAGGPEGLFQNLPVPSAMVGGIIADDRVAAVTLTGSEGAGQAVAEQAGRALKKVVLELGGSDPFIVMPSADLDRAVAEGVKARIQNTGQSCICAKRMIVHRDVYDTFLEKFTAAMGKVKAGDPMDPETDMGPLSSVEQRDTVLAQIAEAKRRGARLLVGGEALAGLGAYMSAGVLVDIDPDGPLKNEEIFGPVAMLFPADDIDHAIRLANDVPFGLGSSVWTRDEAEQRRFVRDVQAGMTAINQMLASTPAAPFGGVKRSGHGRELGPYGLHEFMNLKTVMLG
ncbi:MAG TPA: NAD-dependent succinate-semialdehyde dehydrogenase [Sphingomonas sp.]|nr:NAD-dependent succinate-semialdehyde dehydrogenase [Sphingomonas sp.]